MKVSVKRGRVARYHALVYLIVSGAESGSKVGTANIVTINVLNYE